MHELIIDAWTAAVNRLCQFTVDHIPPIISADTGDAKKIHATLVETSSTRSLLTLFEKTSNQSVTRIIAGKCQAIFAFWDSEVVALPPAAASQLTRIKKLFHAVNTEIAQPLSSAEHAV